MKKSKLPPGTLDKLWENPAHWRALGIYICKEDPRIIVRRYRNSGGWTVNFAHPAGWAAVALCIVGPVIGTILLAREGLVATPSWWLLLAVFVGSLFVGSARLSAPRRYEKTKESE